MFADSSAKVGAANGRWTVQRLIERDAEAELVAPRIARRRRAGCSGDMYAGVPTRGPACVSGVSGRRRSDGVIGSRAASRVVPQRRLLERLLDRRRTSQDSCSDDCSPFQVSASSASARESGRLDDDSPVTVRASPKSSTHTRPSSPIKLAGLKSRCTRPPACAAASPRPASRNTRSASRHGRLLLQPLIAGVAGHQLHGDEDAVPSTRADVEDGDDVGM